MRHDTVPNSVYGGEIRKTASCLHRFRWAIQESAPGMGLQLWVFGFSRDKNNHDSSGAYVNCFYCGLSAKITCMKLCIVRKDRGRI